MEPKQDVKFVVVPDPMLMATGKRAIVYARVSGDDSGKDGRNLAGQLEMGRDYCARRGYQVVAELSEDVKGASGAEIDLPQLNQVREMATAGQFDVLVVRELDRLSRSLGKQLVLEEDFKRHGVQIEFILYDYPDTPEGDLMKHIRGTLAEYERAKIVERNVRGRRLKVRGGSVLCYGRAPYGYRLEKDEKAYRFIVHEPEAKIVRLLFRLWVYDRLTLSAIRKQLVSMGAPGYQKPMRGTADRTWGTSRLRSMLANETYAGLWHFGKRNRKGLWLPREQWVGVPVPALVSREDFEIAQTLLDKNTKRHAVKHEHLMAQRITCGECNHVMNARPSVQTYKGKVWVNRYYRCEGMRGKISKTGKRGHNASAHLIDRAVWQWLKELLLDPERLRQGMAAYAERQSGATAPLREQLDTARSLLEQKRKDYNELLDLYLTTKIRRDVLDTRTQTLNREITSLEATGKELTARLEGATLTEERMTRLEEFAAEIRKRLDHADQDFAKRRWVVETLNATGTWRTVDGKEVLDVQCIIGDEVLAISGISTLHNTQNNKNPSKFIPLILTARLTLK